MNRLNGYVEFWSFKGDYGVVTAEDVKYIKPYTDITLGFVVMYKQPDSKNPIVPPMDSTFDGSLYYGGAPIVTSGALSEEAGAAAEFWKTLGQWSRVIGNRNFFLSIGGWLDSQSTPRLSADDSSSKLESYLKNIVALLESMKSRGIAINGIDFDWEHIAVLYNGQNNQEEQAVALDKCLFLGYLMASLKKAKPDLLITYTTRSNFIYPYQYEGSNRTLWGSDREGYGVAYGIHIGTTQAAVNADMLAGMYSSDTLPPEVITSFKNTLYSVNVMCYDSPVGNISKDGCYTLDDFKSLATNYKAQGIPLELVSIGFEQLRQANGQFSSLCVLGGISAAEKVDQLDTNAVANAIAPTVSYLKDSGVGGAFIWGVNEGTDINNLNLCDDNKCMRDYSLVLGNALSSLMDLPELQCKWYQNKDASGNCVDPACSSAEVDERGEMAQNGPKQGGSRAGGIILTVLGVLAFISVPFLWRISRAGAIGLIVAGIALSAVGIVLLLSKKKRGYVCDGVQGCIETDDGVSLEECTKGCADYQSYQYDSATNDCKLVDTYGAAPDPWYKSADDCRGVFQKSSCSVVGGNTSCSPDARGALTVNTCRDQKVEYKLDQKTFTCSPTCSNVAVTEETCNGQIKYECDGTSCKPKIDGSFSDHLCGGTCSPQLYNCNINTGCEESKNAGMEHDVCRDFCTARTTFKYDQSKGCYPVVTYGRNPDGTYYTSMSSCVDANQKKYTCLEDKCVVSKDGKYLTADCGGECAKCATGTLRKHNPTTDRDECIPCTVPGPPYALGKVCTRDGTYTSDGRGGDCTSGHCLALDCTDSADSSVVTYNRSNHLCRTGPADTRCYSS